MGFGIWSAASGVAKHVRDPLGTIAFLIIMPMLALQSLWADLWILGLHVNVATGYGAPAYMAGVFCKPNTSACEKNKITTAHMNGPEQMSSDTIGGLKDGAERHMAD